MGVQMGWAMVGGAASRQPESNHDYFGSLSAYASSSVLAVRDHASRHGMVGVGDWFAPGGHIRSNVGGCHGICEALVQRENTCDDDRADQWHLLPDVDGGRLARLGSGRGTATEGSWIREQL